MDSNNKTRFVVTAWRNGHELLQLRHDLYCSETLRREKAVNKVFAWRLRKPDTLPLLLESTADIVDVILQDGRGGLQHNALRLLYATALSRFVTGLADTQIDLTRDRPSWFPAGKSLQLPLSLLETRHRIVHRHLPSLAELKRAAADSLEWLWEWYWRQLDYAFETGGAGDGEAGDEFGSETRAAIKEKLQAVLKSYVKERKNEIKQRRQDNKAAQTALSTFTLHFSANKPTQRILLDLLVDEKMILPTDKKLGSSMSGAFLIWTPLLTALCTSSTLPLNALITRLLDHLSPFKVSSTHYHHTSTTPDSENPIKEAIYTWLSHMLTSSDWASARRIAASAEKLHEEALVRIFSAPCFWACKLAEALLDKGDVANAEAWRAVLDAARGEGEGEGEEEGGEMDVDVEDEVEVESIAAALPVRRVGGDMQKKIQGPVKVLGMWKARPIGWLAEEWEDDE
ncbi:hypothetical protein COCMIDRAFT_93388 [Bipolaris oryzae ATCC 44560]|uniref:Las1-domain-containing protein n=1 Tax=Bipolaris oryzae ATCC 44560 TaxID=930090 RepID=W6Z8D3_COCMI|nr:uncharacterized protein COCMIDRAFT_93388 [Bipolaris oryzae ATCC 44560]EUC46235.1 hypothetical protein COCMIDRAFT_93388 [Bipolaris oryzae ATCC 44560]